MATAKQPRKSGRSKKVTDAQAETEVPLATGSEVQQFEADAADHGDGNITSQADGTDDRIRQRAYEIYLARGTDGGNDVDDWLEAERQLRGRSSRDDEGLDAPAL
ncbi:MAG TPA: DUF2934 domain-containing protein [Gemmatimonadaceae bacterium]|jgi:hypothetical protein